MIDKHKTAGRRLLKSYLYRRKLKGESHRSFALKIGMAPAALSHVLTGRVMPTVDQVFAIQKLTGGSVPGESWVDRD